MEVFRPQIDPEEVIETALDKYQGRGGKAHALFLVNQALTVADEEKRKHLERARNRLRWEIYGDPPHEGIPVTASLELALES